MKKCCNQLKLTTETLLFLSASEHSFPQPSQHPTSAQASTAFPNHGPLLQKQKLYIGVTFLKTCTIVIEQAALLFGAVNSNKDPSKI